MQVYLNGSLCYEWAFNAAGNTILSTVQSNNVNGKAGFGLAYTVDGNINASGFTGPTTLWQDTSIPGTRSYTIAGMLFITALAGGTSPNLQIQVTFVEPFTGTTITALLRMTNTAGSGLASASSTGYYSINPFTCRAKNNTTMTLQVLVNGSPTSLQYYCNTFSTIFES